MIDNDALETILTTAKDLSTVVELYDSDAVPGTDGFDPVDALGCFATVAGITFRGVTYQRLISRIGRLSKTVGPDTNTAQVTFSNVTREVAEFEFAHGFEGLIMVIRVLSRSQSVALTDTKIEFAGRCERPDSGDKEAITVTAKFIVGSVDVVIPRRKFAPVDAEGRVPSDPLFEGFIFMPKYGSSSWSRIEHRGGFLRLWNRKIISGTTQWSNYSDLDANKNVPEVLGRAQLQSVLIGATDVGTALQTVSAFCEGEIFGFSNVRTNNPGMPLSGVNYSEHYGLAGLLNSPAGGSYVAPGTHSRTAMVKADVLNSAVDVQDPPPDIVGVVLGRVMKIPDGAGVWGGSEWSDNAAAHVRWVLTDPNYYNLDENWIDDAFFTESYEFNGELIWNTSKNHFTFMQAG